MKPIGARMRKPFATFLAVLSSAVMAAAGTTPAAAQAAAGGCAQGTSTGRTAITSATMVPSTVVVGSTKQKKFVLSVKAEDTCKITQVQAAVFGIFEQADLIDLTRVGTSNGTSTYQIRLSVRPEHLINSDAGRWRTQLFVSGTRQFTRPGPRFDIVRASRLSTHAAPEPVRKGEKLTVRGTLQRANWEKGRYAGHAGQKVQLQFRIGHGSYSKIKTVTSDRAGRLRTTVKASRDGCYRYVFAGNRTTNKIISKADCVDVHR
jgi:hypothetical protein